MTDALKDILSWETTPEIIDYLSEQVHALTVDYITEAQLNTWMDHIKKEMGVKGKPLFQGVRGALTGHDHGPDLKFLIPLTPTFVLKQRLAHLKNR
jgi:nondiscriminating glutamyl-tRNA synthetase